MSYNAIVCKLSNVRRHSNADRLNVASANGNQVIVGLDHKDGDLGIFFGEGGALTEAMCHNNNLFSHKEKNKDQTISGFFGDSGRVRAQKFRGEISEGFWAPLNVFDWTGQHALADGDQFDFLGGHKICQKYYTPATLKAMGSGNKKQEKQVDKYNYSMLLKHYDTKQVRDYINRIPVDAVLYVSEKIHGCVSENSIVDTLEYGKVKISDLVKNKRSAHIKAFNVLTNEIIYSEVADWYFQEDDGDWYRVTLESGETIEITGNNPVWLPEQRCYRRVDELKENDILLVD